MNSRWLWKGLKLQAIVALVLLRHHIWAWETASGVLFVLWRWECAMYKLMLRETALLIAAVKHIGLKDFTIKESK